MTYLDPLPTIENLHPEAYSITEARYAKNQYIVRPLDSKDGWKGPASRCADLVNGRWTNRSLGYHMSPGQVRRFQTAYTDALKS